MTQPDQQSNLRPLRKYPYLSFWGSEATEESHVYKQTRDPSLRSGWKNDF